MKGHGNTCIMSSVRYMIITICYVFVFAMVIEEQRSLYHYGSDKKECQNVRFVNLNAEKKTPKGFEIFTADILHIR